MCRTTIDPRAAAPLAVLLGDMAQALADDAAVPVEQVTIGPVDLGPPSAPEYTPRRHRDRWGNYKRPQMQWSKKRNWAYRATLYREADFTCAECGYRPADELIPVDYDGSATIGDLVIDHIVPLWNDGDRSGPNLQVLCKTCNGRKG